MWMTWHRMGVRWRRLRAQPGRRTLAVFVFHGATEEPLGVPDPRYTELPRLRAQLEAIAKRFSVVPLRAGLAALRRGRVAALQRGGIAGPAAALCFDGALQSTHDLVLPLLTSLGLPATSFVPTAAVGATRPAWQDRLHRALSDTRELTLGWGGLRVSLAQPETRMDAAARLRRELESRPAPRLEAEVDKISRQLGVDPDAPAPPGSPWRALDEASLRRMAASGSFDFGAGAHHHAILSRLPLAAQREEITSALARLRELTGGPAELFAYPRGEDGDWDENTIEFLREAGVAFAFTTQRGQCRRRTHPYELPRVLVRPEAAVEHLFL